MMELTEWMETKGTPLGKIVKKLSGDYSEAAVIYAALKVYETEPNIKNIHVYWKIKHILDTTPFSDYSRRVTKLQKALRLMEKIPWYVYFFGESSGIGVW